MGRHPTGYVCFTHGGRVFLNLTGEGREPAQTDAGRATLPETQVSDTGRYTLDGERLRVPTPWRVMPNRAARGEPRSIVTFARAHDE